LLRVWSAGCASGEELYSVAMVLHELLGRPGEWTLELLGTDIDQEALERARQGIYRAWSFRRTPQDLVARYFTEEGSLWRLRDDIRTMARFARHNLVLDPVPQEDGVPLQFDLVLCRNVLMYMPRSVREDVAARLGESLAPGGRLMVAAVELDGSLFGGLVAERLGGATVYRRPQAGASARRPRSAVPGRKLFDTSSRSSFVGGGVPRRQAGPGAGAPQAIAERTATPREAAAPARSVETAAALAARARAEADRGRPEARSIAERAVSLDPLCAEAHHVLGLLAMERGDLEGAAAHFRRALYVEPGLAPAHLAMAAVAERQGRRSAAARHRAKAVELLSRLAADAEVPGEPGVPAGWLLEMARGGGSGDGAAAEREP
ncbi:MAG TPA: tetratricopeptide repeat protein, partial [Acidobacteria bacterium]|nr:tetratricopeptide repeat protein [Acidobacteriota bacterium]